MVMSVFVVQGGIIGVLGTLLGVIGGILLAINAPALVKLLEQICHTHFISAGIYWIDYLPSRLVWTDVWHVGLAALIMCLLATIYPAWRAAKTQPAEALRYE
jgi:lipoprotein-releasing system permease protein